MANNPIARREYDRRYRRANPELYRAASKRDYEKHWAARHARKVAYRETVPGMLAVMKGGIKQNAAKRGA